MNKELIKSLAEEIATISNKLILLAKLKEEETSLKNRLTELINELSK